MNNMEYNSTKSEHLSFDDRNQFTMAPPMEIWKNSLPLQGRFCLTSCNQDFTSVRQLPVPKSLSKGEFTDIDVSAKLLSVALEFLPRLKAWVSFSVNI